MLERIFHNPNWVFKTGAVLVLVFSFIVGFLHVGVLFLFGLPILGLLVGYILLWFGRAKLTAKAIITLLSLPIIPSSFLLSFYLNKAEPETFLIPQNYRGEIVIYMNEECGLEPVFENGRRVYAIPDTGVLITKFGKNRGYLDRKFYLVDEAGKRTEIPLFARQNFETERVEWNDSPEAAYGELTEETVGAFWAYGSETYYHSRNSIAYRITDYRYFEIADKERWLAGKRFAAFVGELLEQCRASITAPR